MPSRRLLHVLFRATIDPPAGVDEAAREVEVVAGSFEQGVAEIEAKTPDGWRRRNIVVGSA